MPRRPAAARPPQRSRRSRRRRPTVEPSLLPPDPQARLADQIVQHGACLAKAMSSLVPAPARNCHTRQVDGDCGWSPCSSLSALARVDGDDLSVGEPRGGIFERSDPRVVIIAFAWPLNEPRLPIVEQCGELEYGIADITT